MILERDETGLLISPCRECIFAEFEQTQPWHKKQTGCRFNRIDKFKARGTNVVWKEGDAVSANEVHVFCNMLRNQSWADEHKEPLSLLELKARKDNQIKWDAVVWSKEVKCVDDIKSTVLSLIQQTVQPTKILISIDNKDVDFPNLVMIIRGLDLKIPVFFNKVLDSKYPRYLIDHSLSKSSSQYYMCIKSGTKIKEDLVSKIDCEINDECKMVAIAKNNDSSVLIVSRQLHNALNGNSEMISESDNTSVFNIEEKLVVINPDYSKVIIDI